MSNHRLKASSAHSALADLYQCFTHEVFQSKRMLGMCDVTSIAVIHQAKQNGRQNTDLTQRGATLVAVYGSRGDR